MSTPFYFGQQMAEKLARGVRSPTGTAAQPSSPGVTSFRYQSKTPIHRHGSVPHVNGKPAFNTSAFDRSGTQLLGDMSNNAARVGGGILSTVAGGVGTVGTGVAAGLTNAWNAVTPKSMNTSQGWSRGVNDVFNKTMNFTNAGMQDVVGGLGGDTNYNTQQSWNKMEEGFNDPTVDPVSQNVAQAAGWAGHGAWNIGTAVANPGKILANAPRAGVNVLTWARQGSRIIPGARGGVQNLATAHRATSGLRRAGSTINVADDLVASPTEFANAGNQWAQGRAEAQAENLQPQPTQSLGDQYQQWAGEREFDNFTHDTLAGNPTQYSYSNAWQGS